MIIGIVIGILLLSNVLEQTKCSTESEQKQQQEEQQRQQQLQELEKQDSQAEQGKLHEDQEESLQWLNNVSFNAAFLSPNFTFLSN